VKDKPPVKETQQPEFDESLINPALMARIQAMGSPIVPGPAQIELDKRASKKQRMLIAFVVTAGNVTRAAKAAGIDRDTHYAWLKDDSEYAASYRDCVPNAAGVLEDEARRRAVEGTLKGVYHKGALVDMEVEYSDRLLIQLLKAHHPAHKPTLTIDGRGKNGAIAIEQTTAEDLAKLPEETLLEQIKVARETIEWLKASTHATIERAP
jgi:hypothetical protein